uniref:Putative secreted protein n=1 Tax=Ixodes ricinus TaxID=34613 RepID=A0A6B0UF44_IXORI
MTLPNTLISFQWKLLASFSWMFYLCGLARTSALDELLAVTGCELILWQCPTTICLEITYHVQKWPFIDVPSFSQACITFWPVYKVYTCECGVSSVLFVLQT